MSRACVHCGPPPQKSPSPPSTRPLTIHSPSQRAQLTLAARGNSNVRYGSEAVTQAPSKNFSYSWAVRPPPESASDPNGHSLALLGLANRSILLLGKMTTERAAGLPSIVLYALPSLSLLTLYGAFLSGNAVLAPLLGILCGISMFAELIVFPACLFAFVRYPHLRSWPQAGGLALIAAHLFWTFAPLFFVIGAALGDIFWS